MALERDKQYNIAPISLTDMVVLTASGAHTVTGDAVDTLGARAVTFIMIPDTLNATDNVEFGASDSPDDVTYTEVERIKILPTSRQGDNNPLEIMPDIYLQTFGVTSGQRYVKPTLTATAAVVGDITVTVLAILHPELTPEQRNLEVANVYPGDGLP